MVTIVHVPRWGITMEQGKVVGWSVAVGDQVEKGQELVELETEKMVNVVEAPATGVLREIFFGEGEIAVVGELLAIIAEADETYDLEALRQESKAECEDILGEKTRAAAIPERTSGGSVRISPAARRLATGYHLDLEDLVATGSGGNLSQGDIERAIKQKVEESLESCYLETDGFTLHYLSAGGAKAGLKEPGPPLVLLHGIGGSTGLWQANLTALAVRYPVVVVDLPGHGLSDKSSGKYTLEFFAEVISGLLQKLSSEPVTLIGHSLGGQIALQVARSHPEMVDRLVLVAPGGLGPDLELGFLKKILSGLDHDAVRTMLEGLFFDPALVTGPMLEGTYENLSRPGAWEALVSTVSASRSRPYELVKELTIPCLLVVGDKDGIVPPRYGIEAQARFADTQLWIAEECGHCPQIEKSTEFNDRVNSFLAEKRSASGLTQPLRGN